MEKVKELGADLVINYKKTPDFSEVVREYTNKKGVDLILDHVGAKYLEPNMKSLAYKGKLVIIGVISGIKAELGIRLTQVATTYSILPLFSIWEVYYGKRRLPRRF
jgi:NADPH:quinone reductase-like Zn-dependent oxidoreductase